MPVPSLDILAHAAVETARISIPAVLGARRGTLTPAECDTMLRSWAERLLRQVGVELEVGGLEHLAQSTAYVVMSNHQSHYDIPTLFSALPLSLRMVAKQELFRTPLWGPAMTAAGFIAIDRGNQKAAYKALQRGGELMRSQGLSLYIAPEGTRSADGTVASFKRGGFEVARATRAPILPVAIDGTRAILAKGESRVHRGRRVRVRVLAPLHEPDFKDMDGLRAHVRQLIVDALG
jgi:1-acyl-sn-glycerol-3-phosphate acyltransferase